VTDGKVARTSKVRLLRGSEVLFDGRMASLRRFKEDAKDVAAGYECGINLDGFNELQVGDVMEFYRIDRVS